jgi:hypothetical protein
MRNKALLLLPALLMLCGSAFAQIPVEVFGGHARTTLDVMFFKNFKARDGERSPFLLFNRNRASIDYRMTDSTYLPLFGFTEALSYNHPSLKGFAPVAAGQVLMTGVYAKAGVQYAHLSENFTFFGWTVCGIRNHPDVDVFALARYTPNISKQLKLFAQAESLSVFPTLSGGNMSFTQRLRLGLKLGQFQFGAGADLTQAGRQAWITNTNAGGFLRIEL